MRMFLIHFLLLLWLRLRIPSEELLVECIKSDTGVQVAIADNGPGIADDIKTQIFGHLFTTKGVGKGTGLGVAIARQIVVEKHGGSLNVLSEPGQGTEFVIQISL